jgi:F-type H+-transporting ATPase subunit epsilon
MYLEILTPDQRFLQNHLASVTLPGFEGEFTVMPNHAQLCASLKDGLAKILTNEELVQTFFIKNALAFVNNNAILIHCEYALDLSDTLIADQIDQQILECARNLEKKGKDLIFQQYWRTRLNHYEVIKSCFSKQSTKI